MDDTLISNNTWMDFNLFMGMSEDEDYALYKQFVSGEIDYVTWTQKLVECYKQHGSKPKEEIEAFLTTFTLATHAQTAVAAAKERGLYTVILTGSFQTTADAVAKELNIDKTYANTTCLYDDAGKFLEFKSGGDEETAKVRTLNQICKDFMVEPHECIAIGDGANDIKLFKATKNGVTFTNCSEEVQLSAKYIIDSLEEFSTVLN